MNGEEFAAEPLPCHVMEPWPDEPDSEGGLAWARSGEESDGGVSRLRKLPPGPFRSAGGYLDYGDWPDRKRFMELDHAIRRHGLQG